MSKINVSAGGLECTVLDSFYDFVKCQVEAAASTSNSAPHFAGSGITLERYSREGRSASSFRTWYHSADQTAKDNIFLERRVLNNAEHYGQND